MNRKPGTGPRRDSRASPRSPQPKAPPKSPSAAPAPSNPTPRSADAPLVARFPAGPKVREWARTRNFSDWMVARWVKLVDDPAPFLEGLCRRPPKYLRVNPLRGGADEVKARLESRGFSMSRSDLDPNIMRLRQIPISAGATLEHMLGMTTPQDLASASAPIALGAQPGDVVADLAAAPGVKTLHVAGDMARRGAEGTVRERGAIVAVEPDADRVRALRFNLERGGATSVVIRRENAQDLPGTAWADKVLLDAPCTGEGTIPKDRNRRMMRIEEVSQMAALQRELADAADRVLKPGGTLVYATCTFGPEENEAQVQRLVDRGYRIEPLPFSRAAGVALQPGVTEWPGLTLDQELRKTGRFLPGVHPTLGFYVARLRKGGA